MTMSVALLETNVGLSETLLTIHPSTVPKTFRHLTVSVTVLFDLGPSDQLAPTTTDTV